MLIDFGFVKLLHDVYVTLFVFDYLLMEFGNTEFNKHHRVLY